MKCIAFPVAALLAATVVAQSQAQNLITGQVNLSGGIILNQNTLGAATSGIFDTTSASLVALGSGSYSGSVGDAITWTSGGLSFGAGNQSISPLWSFSGGGESFSFALASIASYTVIAGDTTATLIGNGTLAGTGIDNYTPTSGTFTLVITDASGGYSDQATFGFNASDSAASPQGNDRQSAPDGGLTVALLGGALAALGALRRKLS